MNGLVLADGGWLGALHVAGQIAGVVLLIELMLVLVVLLALVVAIWFAVRWTRANLVPIIDLYGARAESVLSVATRGSDRLARGVAEFQGQQEGIKTAVLAFVLGPRSARVLLRQTPLPPPPATVAP